MEQLPNQEEPHLFVFPDLRSEAGEIERVGKHFNIKNEDFVEKFIQKASSLSLVPLSEDIWSNLENTDSVDIKKDDWKSVEYLSGKVNRDWESLKTRIESGDPLDAPIIAKSGDTYHLVGGNTRLMVLRAAGVVPDVLIVNIKDLN